MKPGRKNRIEAVDKTTVYFLEKDLLVLDEKNRFRALKIAREISKKAVSDYATMVSHDLEVYRKEMAEIGRGIDSASFVEFVENNS